MTAPQATRILIIDDEQASRLSIRITIESLKLTNAADTHHIEEAASLSEAYSKLQESNFQIVILDKDLGPDINGKQIRGTDHIKDILSIRPYCQVLIMTADQDPTLIASAIRSGATDYLYKSLDKGFREYREAILEKVLRQARSDIETAAEANSTNSTLYGEFVGISSTMQKTKALAEAYSESNRPVLILGASGLGKGAIARVLNNNRKKYLTQKNRPFLNINIGSMNAETAQSELFGHEAHSFTGAGPRNKIGLLESGDQGDIFFDEIGDASPEIQIKILKVIEEREFTRLGGKDTIKTNARFIFATNKDLNELVSKGMFRADLLARISTLEIEMPPLSERKEDIPDIIRVICEKINAEHRDRKIQFSSMPTKLIQYFSRSEIPGNIRGIENDLIRLALGSPKGTRGFVDLQGWQKILRINVTGSTEAQPNLSYESVKNLKTDFLGNDFPGLRKVRETIERRILEEACEKLSSLSEISKILKITKPAVHQKLKAERLKIKSRK